MALIDAIRLLPRVGDKRMEVPSPKPYDQAVPKRERCVVVQVNPRGLWYRVRFVNSGHYECYKVPDLDRRNT